MVACGTWPCRGWRGGAAVHVAERVSRRLPHASEFRAASRSFARCPLYYRARVSSGQHALGRSRFHGAVPHHVDGVGTPTISVTAAHYRSRCVVAHARATRPFYGDRGSREGIHSLTCSGRLTAHPEVSLKTAHDRLVARRPPGDEAKATFPTAQAPQDTSTVARSRIL